MYRGTITPDGKSVVVIGPDRRIYSYALAGGEPTVLPGIDARDRPMRYSEDGRTLYVQQPGVPSKIVRYDVATGRIDPWKEISPSDPAGLSSISRAVVAPDGKTYAYSYLRILSFLQLVDGLK
jgi:hypothetical protein